MERTSDHKVFRIVYVGKFDANISHEMDSPGLQIGDKVHCKIDWPRRYLFMRYHTAAHVLSAVIHRETGALITGNQIAEDKTRIDFSLEEFSKDKIYSYAEEANRIIQEALPVRFSFLSRQELEGDMVKLAKGFPPEMQEFRIVEIQGLDKQACGGCHVKNTSEIGKIHVKDVENKGKSNRRAYFELEE
jgi:misacylated tRNA(Ala) deacylase